MTKSITDSSEVSLGLASLFFPNFSLKYLGNAHNKFCDTLKEEKIPQPMFALYQLNAAF